MADLIFKLRLLRWFLSNAFADWQGEIWRRDLDAQGCCDGRECCCGGETVRQQWRWIVKGNAGE